MRTWQTLGARVILLQVAFALAIAAMGIAARTGVMRLERRRAEYEERRLPALEHLDRISDIYAIDVVDAVHKLADGTRGPRDGARTLEAAGAAITAELHVADSLLAGLTLSLSRPRLDSLLAQADASRREALSIITAGDVAALRRWRVNQMYVRVDPLTAEIRRLLELERAATTASLRQLQEDLRSATRIGLLILAATGIAALLAGILMAMRLLGDVGKLQHVLRAAGAGDRVVRVKSLPTAELADVAVEVDRMLDSVAAAEFELRGQADALGRSEAEARAASASKSAFLGSVSHELRTPLNVILGYADLLRDEPGLTAEQRKGIQRIGEAGSYLLSLIDDVIGVARLDADALKIQEIPFDPAALLADVSALLEQRARAKDLALVVSAAPDIPSSVSGDPRRLKQVLVNLGGNAIKFTETGTVEMRMSWDDERLSFTVSDTGPGMTEEEQGSLFQTFSQGAAGRAAAEGVGLGLFISRELVHRMGGDIHLESAPGMGARFHFDVQAAPAAEAAVTLRASARRRLVPGTRCAPMLVVDDRASNREVLSSVLKRAGFEVDVASNGAEALERIAERRYAMVWMDVRMPVLNGVEAVRQLRADELRTASARLPVIAITASLVDLDTAGARAYGFDDMVPKPFRAELVLDMIVTMLDVRFEELPAELSPITDHRRFDVTTLSGPEREALLGALVAGDLHEATRLATALGPRGDSLRAEIESFHTDALLDRLRHATPSPGVPTNA